MMVKRYLANREHVLDQTAIGNNCPSLVTEYVLASDHDDMVAKGAETILAAGRKVAEAGKRIRELEADLESVRAINKALAEVLADERANNRQWLAANAPGGWIDDLRKGSPLSDGAELAAETGHSEG